jgi:hypothetical protein
MIQAIGRMTGHPYPAEADVAFGVEFGPELYWTGEIVAGGAYPPATEVLLGTPTDGIPGRWHPAPVNKVEELFEYGVDGISLVGELEGGVGEIHNNLAYGVNNIQYGDANDQYN